MIANLLRRIARSPRRGERGQMLLVFALGIVPVTLAIGVAAVDASFWQSQRRSAQAAADLAALAAAYEVADLKPSEAETAAWSNATENGYQDEKDGVDVNFTYPYNGDDDLVEVTIDAPTAGLFIDAFGIPAPKHGARAVAEVLVRKDEKRALHTDSLECHNPLLISGSGITVNGLVHSNSGFTNPNSGARNSFDGYVTYHGDDPCNFAAGNGFFRQGFDRVRDPVDWPLEYHWNDIDQVCTHMFNSNGIHNLNDEPTLWQGNNPNSKRLKDNVICARNGDMLLDADDVSGNVTLVSRRDAVRVIGDHVNLTPRWNFLLLYSDANEAEAHPAIEISVTDNNSTLEGYIHAPNSRCTVRGSDTEVNGALICEHITLSGNRLKIDGDDGGPIAPVLPVIRLRE